MFGKDLCKGYKAFCSLYMGMAWWIVSSCYVEAASFGAKASVFITYDTHAKYANVMILASSLRDASNWCMYPLLMR